MAENTKVQQVVYDGPSSKSDPSGIFEIDGVELIKGVPADVEDEALRKELLAGESERLKGHKFSAHAPKATTDSAR